MARIIKVVPVRFEKTGYVECSEKDATFFSVLEYKTERRYGEGWFPLYSDSADAYGYMFKSKASADSIRSELSPPPSCEGR